MRGSRTSFLVKYKHQYLLSMKEVVERQPECSDVEEKWEEIAKAYIPDGIREFQDFPSASLGWMMYIGMAVAQLWDTDWGVYSKVDDLYAYLRDKRGYDHMDEYIREEVLQLSGADYTLFEKQTGECASRVYNALVRQHIAEGVAMGYSHIFCIIDMDTKDKEPERSQYQKLKAKYAKPINKPRKASTAKSSSLRLTAAPNCSSFTISATPHVHTTNMSHCSKT